METDELIATAAYLLGVQHGLLIACEEMLFDKPDGRSSPRKRKRPVDYSETTWGRMLRDDTEKLSDDSTPEARIFRLRFRVPFFLFLLLLDWTRSWREKSDDNPDGLAAFNVCGVRRVPTDLLLLGVLRILGRGTCLDGILELSGISVTTMDLFFHKFAKQYRKKLFPLHVHMPSSPSEISSVLGAFAAVAWFPWVYRQHRCRSSLLGQMSP